MSSATAVAALVLLLALTYWAPLGRVRRALGVAHLVATGHAFLVLGFVAGLPVDVEDKRTLARDLGPVVAFIAGWVGFATGMRFDLRVLRTVPARAFGIALLPAAGAAVLVGVASLALLWGQGSTAGQTAAAALVLAAGAASSGPTLAASMRARRAGRDPRARATLRMIEFAAGIDDVIVVILAVLAFALVRPAAEPLAPAALIGVGVAGGVVLGVTTWLFLYGPAGDDERLLLGLAMLALVAGFGAWLYLSPAAIAFVAAFVVANLPGGRAALLIAAVQRVERPAAVILMAVIGFHIAGSVTWHVAPLVAILTVLRAAAKRYAGGQREGIIPGAPGLATVRDWSLGLTPQGILGLMVTLSFFHVWQNELARTVLAAVAGASLINELIAPRLLLGALRAIRPGPMDPG
ncbi:MAG TPA: hypothetical protein VML75_17225 [Kofleriaceae bacterium]|nr:hypothetical protein [Kofleriaceae bacterium]